VNRRRSIALAVAIAVAAAVGLALTLARNWSDVTQALHTARWGFLVLAIATAMISVALAGMRPCSHSARTPAGATRGAGS
jgi:uncharacterized membrane protein YbhN (UPF0104 family)